ncbi:hypothetical protein DPMN_156669 [Dreissena polymorpha]|uniref:Myb/SANT-like DNA-binding domain-containing protein n=1 Tax=Dreissena polymorpha TaxID=45954 RepID=A0A9D4J7S5_DREPO|nr:hypothetical protein DPMN_156669 [Dreissena polymorpha]
MFLESLPENQIPDKDTSSTSWTRSQTLLILEQYKANVDEFINPLLKKQLWEELCKSLNSKGNHFNSKQVKGRLKTIVAAYRRAKDSNRATGATFEFKAQLDYILGEKHDTSQAFTISNLESASSSSACTGDSEEDTDSGEEPNVKNTVEPTRKRKSSLNQILQVLKQYGEEEKQKEHARLDVAKQMHNEKVDLLKNLIDMMKQK